MPSRIPPTPDRPASFGAEVTTPHTRLLRISLAIEESRNYWEYLQVDIPKEDRPVIAFEERWFGNKSMARVRRLLSEFSHRYDAYPEAIAILSKWRPVDLTTRQNICHWHLQLTDPIYRQFTAEFLEQRRLQTNAKIDRDGVVRWVTPLMGSDWSISTTQRLATGLLTAASSAGLCTSGSGSRSLSYPKVTDEALSYWLYFLRHLTFEGTLLENPYFASVGLTEGFLEQRLRRLSSLAFNRMGDLYDFGWKYPDLRSWATQQLAIAGEGEA
jgi:hypothetical protein